MTKQTEALKLALDALEAERVNYQDWDKEDGAPEYIHEAITALQEALAEDSSGTEQREHLPTRRAVERELERLANHTGMHLNDGKERVTLPGGTLRRMLNLIDRASPPAQRKPLTKTKVGNYLRRHAHGEVGMYRNGFKDGVAFAEAAHGIKENV